MSKEKNAPKSKASKNFKLGPKASLFVDPATGKKIVNKQIVSFEDHQMKSEQFRAAVQGGHIVFVPPGEEEETSDLEKFTALKTNKLKAKYLKDTYDLTADEVAEVDDMNTEQLIEAFKSYEGIDTEPTD